MRLGIIFGAIVISAIFCCIFSSDTYAILSTYNRGGIDNMASVPSRYQATLDEIARDSQDPYAVMGSKEAGAGSQDYLLNKQGEVESAVLSPAEIFAQQQAAQKRAELEASKANTQKAIDSLGTELKTGYGNIDREAASLTSKYDGEKTQNETDYNEQTIGNNQDLLKNKQNSLLAGAQGARGLRSVLASLGALSGDGLKLANRAVTSETNKDIGGALDTATNNATTLDKAIERFRIDDGDRRKDLETQKGNQRTALEGRTESKRQDLFKEMAKILSDMGDTAGATEFLNRAGNLNETIARKTAVQATPFSKGAAAFTPGELADYLAGAGDMTVTAETGGTPGANSPNSILAGRPREDERRRAIA